MGLKETIISKHIVKPSSPTPDKFKHYKLSYLDQIVALGYIPLIFFYENDESKHKPHAEISQLLRQSLSQILTVCYPLAGTIHGNSFVDCDDSGVEFLEARVHARLAQVIEEPHMEELRQLVPADSISHRENAILLVKLNFFDCGGIALGVCLSHKVGDFASLAVLMDAWARTCFGKTPTTQPCFDFAVNFPPRDSTPTNFPPDREKITTRRLVFDKEKLERLKQEAAGCSEVKDPTRVEALSVFLWKQYIEAYKSIIGTKKSFAAHHAINLRPRTIPPIPDQTIGNFSIACFAFASESSDILSELRSAIRAVDDNYIKRVVNSDKYLRMVQQVGALINSDTELFSFTSWWRFPVYGVDFGWGNPVWVTLTTMPYNNTVIFMTTPSQDGIEAWLNMSDHFFQLLVTNYNKLAS